MVPDLGVEPLQRITKIYLSGREMINNKMFVMHSILRAHHVVLFLFTLN